MLKHLRSGLPAITLMLLLTTLWSCNNTNTSAETAPAAPATGMPHLIDLGASKCIPCQKMSPVLDQLKEDFRGEMGVEFIDVWETKEQAAAYNIQMIPTQIFYAPDGTELYRHMGFYSREQILQKWAELGYSFGDRN